MSTCSSLEMRSLRSQRFLKLRRMRHRYLCTNFELADSPPNTPGDLGGCFSKARIYDIGGVLRRSVSTPFDVRGSGGYFPNSFAFRTDSQNAWHLGNEFIFDTLPPTTPFGSHSHRGLGPRKKLRCRWTMPSRRDDPISLLTLAQLYSGGRDGYNCTIQHRPWYFKSVRRHWRHLRM